MKIGDFLQTESGERKQELQKMFANFPARASVVSVNLPAGRTIVQQDEPCRSVFVLVEGCARTIIHQGGSKVHAFSEFYAIEFFGEYEVLGGIDHYLADVQAQTDCLFLAISSADYLRWMLSDSRFFLTRTRGVVRTLLSQTAQGRSSLYMGSTDRTVKFVLDYYDTHTPMAGEDITIAKTHAAISEEIGFSLRTVNRAINQLAAEGLVTLRRGKMVVSPGQYARLRQHIGQ